MKFKTAMWTILLSISWVAMGVAGTIYQYTDKDGVRRFSDSPPQTEQPVTTSRAHTTPKKEKPIVVTSSKRDGHTWLTIKNRLHGPMEVELSFKTLTNLTSKPPLPHRFVIKGRSELAAVQLQVIQPGTPTHYRYHYRYIIGAPGSRHAPRSPYLLPYKPGQAYKVTQAFNGTNSHFRDSSRHAVDFKMPVGTPIVCSRKGIVVFVQQGYVWGGTNRDYYLKRVNGIRILHPDGTMAFYGHLKRGSARVQTGDRVEAGQVIAESGNTGYSSGPHLHFVIQINENLKWKSIPFEFKGSDGRGMTPVKGKKLRAS